MVVLVIIGLASAVVVLAMPDPRGRLTDEAERFAARALAARDDAIVQGRSISIAVDAQGYTVARRTQGRWQASGDRLFAPVAWTQGTQVALGTTGQLRVTFDSTGASAAPVVVALSRDAASARIAIDADGGVRVGG